MLPVCFQLHNPGGNLSPLDWSFRPVLCHLNFQAWMNPAAELSSTETGTLCKEGVVVSEAKYFSKMVGQACL